MFTVRNESFFKETGQSTAPMLQREWWTTCPNTSQTSLHGFLSALSDCMTQNGTFAGADTAAVATLIATFAVQANVAKVVAAW